MADVGKKISKVTGAAVGGTSALAVVISGGTSAAGLTSGLAAVGSIVGGSMLAGIFVVAAAPIVGGALGYGCYRMFKRLASK